MQALGTKKILQPLRAKKSRDLSGPTKKSLNLSIQKKIMQPFGTKKSCNLSTQKILQPHRKKKITQLLGTTKIMQPFGTAKIMESLSNFCQDILSLSQFTLV